MLTKMSLVQLHIVLRQLARQSHKHNERTVLTQALLVQMYIVSCPHNKWQCSGLEHACRCLAGYKCLARATQRR